MLGDVPHFMISEPESKTPGLLICSLNILAFFKIGNILSVRLLDQKLKFEFRKVVKGKT